MSEPVTITDLTATTSSGCNELTALVDGEPIHIRVPEDFPLHARGEFFVGIALLEAMCRNAPIQVDSSIPVSRRLLSNLPEIQAVYACWHPNLYKIDVEAHAMDDETVYSSVGSFFSAGVDGSHALYRHKDEITHLIMCSGFDVGNDEKSWTERIDKQTAFANSIGKTLVPVVTNARQWLATRSIAWLFGQGLFLSSIGPNLGFKRVYVPASHTYSELFPWGTHPLTDPMWSTESTTVVHDGAGFRRGEKMKDLCRDQHILDNLQVCWRSTTRNCGECGKCVRVMTALYLLDATSRSVPSLHDPSALKVFRNTDESGATFLEDLMILAREVGDDAIYRKLRRYQIRYQLQQLSPLLDQYLLGGFLRRLHRRIRNPDWAHWRVTGQPIRR